MQDIPFNLAESSALTIPESRRAPSADGIEITVNVIVAFILLIPTLFIVWRFAEPFYALFVSLENWPARTVVFLVFCAGLTLLGKILNRALDTPIFLIGEAIGHAHEYVADCERV